MLAVMVASCAVAVAVRRRPTLPPWSLAVLVAASRKRFLGSTLAAARAEHRPGTALPDGAELPSDAEPARPPAPGPVERDVATAAVSVLAARAGAWAVRVHDVRATADALAVQRAWSRAGG